MSRPITERLQAFLELFGWYVMTAHDGPLPVQSEQDLTVEAVWELGSRWSPPHARICLLFLAHRGGAIAIETAVMVADNTICRLPDADQLPLHSAVDLHQVETFVANLGRHRSHPGRSTTSTT